MLGLLEAFAASYLSLLTDGAFGAEYKDVFAFLVLILILIFRPRGCSAKRCGRARRERSLRQLGLCVYIAASCLLAFYFPQSVLVFSLWWKRRCCCSTTRRWRRRVKIYLAALVVARAAAVPRIGERLLSWRSPFRSASMCALALGFNIVVGFVGLLNLGFVAFLRHRRLSLGDLRLAAGESIYRRRIFPLSANWFFVFLILSIVVGALNRRSARFAGVAAARRLSRRRHARLRRSRARAGQQSRQADQSDQRPARHLADRQAAAVFQAACWNFSACRLPTRKLYPLYFYFLVLLMVLRHHPRHPAPGKLARRPGLESDSRRRNRRIGDGRSGRAYEAARLCRRRVVRLAPSACCSPPSRFLSIPRVLPSWNPSACSPW